MTRDKVLAMKIQDPTDTERLNDNLVNGVDVVGDMTPDQMGYFRPFAGWSSYRTPVDGPLYVRRLLPSRRRRARGRRAQRRDGDRGGLQAQALVGLMPERAAKFTVNAPPQELWKFLRDFEALCSCIPGVERIRLVDPRTAELTVKEKIGVVPLIVNLTARIDSEDPPRRLHATASAEHLTMAIDVTLQASGSATELHSLFNVKGEGPLKPVVDRPVRAARHRAHRPVRRGPGEALRRPPERAAARESWLARVWRRLQRSSARLSRPSS